MSKVCEISGKKVLVGNNVSKAMNKTKRRFEPNLIKKRFFIPEEGKWITLKVSTAVLKTINKKGISAVLKELKKIEFKLWLRREIEFKLSWNVQSIKTLECLVLPDMLQPKTKKIHLID